MKTPLGYEVRSMHSSDYYTSTSTSTSTSTFTPFVYKVSINKEDFSNKTFKNISIYNSEIRNSDFTNSYMIGAVFNQTNFINVMFKELTAPFCRFNMTTFQDIDFSNSELSHVNFDFTRFERVDFSNCNMPNISAVNAIFHLVKFDNANLKYSIFANKGISPQFMGTKFDNADLTGSTLVKDCAHQDMTKSYADLSNAILDEPSLIHLISILKNKLATSKFVISDKNGLREVGYIGNNSELTEIANYQSKLDSLISLEELVHHKDLDVIGNTFDINDSVYFEGTHE